MHFSAAVCTYMAFQILSINQEHSSDLWAAAANSWPFILTGIYTNGHIISDIYSVGGDTQRMGEVMPCLLSPASRYSYSQLWMLMRLVLSVKRHLIGSAATQALAHKSALRPLAVKRGSWYDIGSNKVWLLWHLFCLQCSKSNIWGSIIFNGICHSRADICSRISLQPNGGILQYSLSFWPCLGLQQLLREIYGSFAAKFSS